MGQCLGELDPDPTQPVGPTWFQLTPNLEAKSAGKCWFARRDLQAGVRFIERCPPPPTVGGYCPWHRNAQMNHVLQKRYKMMVW